MAGTFLQATGYAGNIHFSVIFVYTLFGHSLFLRYCILRVCYERVKIFNPVIATFFLSAWWHGFYFAYYSLFVLIALNIMAARKVILYITERHKPSHVLWSILDEATIASSLSVPPVD